ncbi:hypothetical protein HPB52_013876 [Rhipicephalus sanguineus]|uniref:Uncharacterized protein n=1 Tax=Rhipicephalus sanguineus TaxID=34632 RepID=A0A9D4TAB4_RHISA|nr:hypothetical protein HPB52_013876 [Rhipicephalus sanguineus]
MTQNFELEKRRPSANIAKTTPRDVSVFQVCRTCMQSIRRDRMPNFSTRNGRLLNSDSGQFAIKGPIANVPVNVNTTVQMLPRDDEEDQALFIHIKRRMIYKCGMVNTDDLRPCLAFLKQSTLYRYYGIRISREQMDKVCENLAEPSNENGEHVDYPEDNDNPMETSSAMSLGQQTLVIDDSNVLVIAPGEGVTPLNIAYDEHAEELSFPQIYLGEPRNINPTSKPSVYTMASSECRRTDRRGAAAYHVLYVAAKVMGTRTALSANVFFKNMTGMGVVTKAHLEDR